MSSTQFSNILSISSTRSVLKNRPKFKLVIEMQSVNIPYISRTFLVSNCEISSSFTLLRPENISIIFVTLAVLNFFISNFVILEQSLNIASISSTFSVSNPDTSNEFNVTQPLNIKAIFLTFLVLKLVRSIDAKWVQLLKVWDISTTKSVFNFGKSKLIKLEHESKA